MVHNGRPLCGCDVEDSPLASESQRIGEGGIRHVVRVWALTPSDISRRPGLRRARGVAPLHSHQGPPGPGRRGDGFIDRSFQRQLEHRPRPNGRCHLNPIVRRPPGPAGRWRLFGFVGLGLLLGGLLLRRLRAAFFLATFFFLDGLPDASRSLRRAIASSSVIDSAVLSFGIVAFTSPCFTYWPYRPS